MTLVSGSKSSLSRSASRRSSAPLSSISTCLPSSAATSLPRCDNYPPPLVKASRAPSQTSPPLTESTPSPSSSHTSSTTSLTDVCQHADGDSMVTNNGTAKQSCSLPKPGRAQSRGRRAKRRHPRRLIIACHCLPHAGPAMSHSASHSHIQSSAESDRRSEAVDEPRTVRLHDPRDDTTASHMDHSDLPASSNVRLLLLF